MPERALFALVFAAIAGGLGVAGSQGGLLWLAFWPALSFALLGAAYAGVGPGLLGKRKDGTRAWWALLLFGPLFLLLGLIWQIQRRLVREACSHRVAEGLWLGRRPYLAELPSEVRLVVDLTSEFPAAAGITRHCDYLAIPTLDGLAPEASQLQELVALLRDHPGPVLLHCAMGRGRSALVAAAVLLARRIANDPRGAESLLQSIRPGVRLSAPQRRLLRQWSGGWAQSKEGGIAPPSS
ncbi:MAG: hypothetical protein U0840_14620 [Gemmataceae bacterium]